MVRLVPVRLARFTVLVVASLAACTSAPGPPAPRGAPGGESVPVAPEPKKTLVMMINAEPDSLAGTALTARTGTTAGRRRLFNAGLILRDGANQPMPYLAQSLPQLNTESWRVLPDGRMETTYRLKPNLLWHDGQPLTAEDFAFAWRVYSTPLYGQTGNEPINMIEEVTAPDPRTALFRWKGPYAEAGLLEAVVSTGAPTGGPSFTPLPRHVLERAYEEQPDTLLTHPFWTHQYVGAGPYRLDRWEVGAFIEAAAFDGHVLGRPKIERVRITWSSDPNTVLANLLSGEAHLAVDSAIGLQQGQVLKPEWEASGAGTVRFDPRFWRYIGFQHRPDYANPKAQLDVRVRRALAHTVDREAINEGLYSGLGLLADTLFYPTVPFADELSRAVTRYPLDPRRAEALMAEAGYRKGSDGLFESPAEGRLQFQVRSLVGAMNESERSILTHQWKQLGFDVEQVALSQVEAQSGEIQGTFRSMQVGASPAGAQGIGFFTSATIPRPENRWVGANRGGFSHPEYDQYAVAVQSTLEAAERVRAMIGAARILSEQVGAISLYFNPSPVTFPSVVKNMDLRVPDADLTWNIHAWEM